jgi:hypothetical protein
MRRALQQRGVSFALSLNPASTSESHCLAGIELGTGWADFSRRRLSSCDHTDFEPLLGGEKRGYFCMQRESACIQRRQALPKLLRRHLARRNRSGILPKFSRPCPARRGRAAAHQRFLRKTCSDTPYRSLYLNF